MEKPALNPANVAELAKQIADTQKELESLCKSKDDAARAYNSCHCRLSNLRNEFTRAIAGTVVPDELLRLGVINNTIVGVLT